MEQKEKEMLPGGWKINDVCLMITNKRKGYTTEYTIEGYDGRYFELRDKQGRFYRAAICRLFRNEKEALASLHNDGGGANEASN